MHTGALKRLMFVLALLVAPAASSPGREIPITILQTTDLHGRLLPSAESGQSAGGLLQCASIIRNVRARERNVLLVDCGDLIQGSAESWLTQGRVMVRALEWLNYDAWVPGNHDFDWGFAALERLQRETRIPTLAANVWSPEGATHRLDRIRPFVMKDVDGVRVALVGLTTPGIPMWLLPDALGDLRFKRSVEALAAVMPMVRAEKPDVLVLLAHQGYQAGGDDEANEINLIARRFPEFDVILGGHLHRELSDMKLNGVLYSQGRSYGAGVGRVDLVFDNIRGRVVRKSSEIVPAVACPADPDLAQLLEPDLGKARAYLDEVVGSASCDMEGSTRMPGQSAIQQLIAAAIAEAAKAEVVLHGLLAEASLARGPIRRADAWRIIPYENRIGVLYLTPQELRDVLEENAELAGTAHFLGVRGIGYDFYPKAQKGNRVRNLRLADGSLPNGRRRFRVASNSYALASGGGRFPALRRLAGQPNSRLEMTEIDTRAAVVDYVRKHNPLCFEEGREVQVVRRDPGKSQQDTP
jgi:2',3'-cyclic-nucleotide 2'-phosphodiesterase (5'-nucleotidase family)